ncbi:MAG: shikimate dehydrogenase [PVC group bacterium]
MNIVPDSSTVLTGLFGDPVSHSISPRIHNAAFASARLNWLYLAFPVRPDDLEAAFRGFRVLGGRGLNITIPHKRAVIPFLDELSGEARLIGAVNTVLFRAGRAAGYNTDGPGFARALREDSGFSLAGKSVCLIGAGGAGRAAAVQAALEGASRIEIADLSLERAGELSGWINEKIRSGIAGVFEIKSGAGAEIIGGCDLLVDATPLGLKPGDPVSFDPSLLSPGTLVMDLVYNPLETPLLKATRKRGLKGINGLGMLVYQAAAAWEIWTGKTAPVDVMKAAAREALCGKKQTKDRMTKSE